MKKATDISANITAIIPKKFIGLYVRYNFKIVFRTFMPSEYVFNLETLPSGLSLYSITTFLINLSNITVYIAGIYDILDGNNFV